MTQPIDYPSVLNPAQLDAVTTLEGPVLVIAGAGSGKTRTLVYRVARLVEEGVPPESILLLTFTRKAAQEMLERASNLADARCKRVSGGTFHSLALRVLRIHGELLGMRTSFTVLDRSDMEEIIGSLVPGLELPKGALRFPKRGTLANILSKAANLQEPVDRFMMEEYGQFLPFIPQVKKLSHLYAENKRRNHLMDYDDLILNLRRLLEEHSAVRESLSRQYRYILVDEYQDTNSIQADIVKWLAYDHHNVMVVGDDAQSIYSFRGANYRNMFEFQQHFPEAKVIKLEENYRSTQPILTMTNALMDQATERFTKCLHTRRRDGDVPQVLDTRTEPEQALFICQYVQEQMRKGRSLSNMAVLFRAGYHSFELEAELTRQGIPYVKYGGFKFLESAHIKDFLAHLRVTLNRDEAVSWIRILRLVEGVGHARSHGIIDWMKQNDVPPGGLHQWPGCRSKDQGLQSLGKLLTGLTSEKLDPREAVEKVMAYYLPILKEKFDDYPRRSTELEQLMPMAARYRNLRNFLDDLVLEPPSSPADMEPGQRSEALILSTVHSAKGLEWPVVVIMWVMEGRFPSARAYQNPADLEEERRLMYVAATRAKDRLVLCYPGEESVPLWFSEEMDGARYRQGLSFFIQALPEGVVQHQSVGAVQQVYPSPARVAAKKSTLQDQHQGEAFSMGDRVRHPAFGPGVVSKFMGEDKVEVLFRNVGRKLLHLEYTTLEKI